MSYEPQPYTEHPNLRAAVALIVDDPAPCINPLWYFRRQVDGEAEPDHEAAIPLDFMEEWCSFVDQTHIAGDFTILPFPAGLGSIDHALLGCDTNEVGQWLDLAREHIAPRFDIHCEILTHTRALDLITHELLPVSEHEWMESQDEATLTAYFSAAMRILKDAGLPNHGLTQPCTYTGDESLYARALLAAEKTVNGRSVTHNFLHVDSVAPVVPPRITLLDEVRGEAVVSIWSATDDHIWNVQYRGNADSSLAPEVLADRYVTQDGAGGRIADLVAGGGPVVLVTHWQTLYSNGSRLGLATYREIVRRIGNLYGDRLEWRKLSDIASGFLAAQTAKLSAIATRKEVCIDVASPYSTNVLTVSVPTPWPLYEAPGVMIDGARAEQVGKASELSVGKWVMRGSILSASLAIERGHTRQIVITAAR